MIYFDKRSGLEFGTKDHSAKEAFRSILHKKSELSEFELSEKVKFAKRCEDVVLSNFCSFGPEIIFADAQTYFSSSLQSLKLNQIYFCDETLSKLPETLIALELFECAGFKADRLNLLPRNLDVFSLTTSMGGSSDLRGLPPCLTGLSLAQNYTDFEIKEDAGKNLPIGLKTLSLHRIKSIRDSFFEGLACQLLSLRVSNVTCYGSFLEHQTSLKNLKIVGCCIRNKTLMKLPMSLEYLELADTWVNDLSNLSHLKTLDSLCLSLFEFDEKAPKSLPIKVSHLSIMCLRDCDWWDSFLDLSNQRTLKTLYVESDEARLIQCKHLPQSLTHLDLDCFGYLPGSLLEGVEHLTNLQDLTLNDLYDVIPYRLVDLPSSLKVLKCEESDMDDCHIKNLWALTQLETLNIAGSSKITGATFAFLPDSLIKLDVRGVLWFSDIELDFLPRKLKWIKSSGSELYEVDGLSKFFEKIGNANEK